MLVPSANAVLANQLPQGPSQDMPSQKTRSQHIASSSSEGSPFHSLMYQGDETTEYALVCTVCVCACVCACQQA